MTLSLSLLSPTSDSNANPLNRDADCTKRNIVLPPFGGITTTTQLGGGAHCRSGPFPTSTSTSTTVSLTTTTTTNAYAYPDASTIDVDSTETNPDQTLAFVARQSHSRWTGMPIRAIVPLPRRAKLGVGIGVDGRAAQDDTCSSSRNVRKSCFYDSRVYPTRSARVEDDVDTTDSATEINDEDDGEDIINDVWGSDEDDDDAAPASGCCLYESITAAHGLSAWSFEELRVECYAQSSVARGTRPPPVVSPCLAIPPAFVPRSVLRNKTGRSLARGERAE